MQAISTKTAILLLAASVLIPRIEAMPVDLVPESQGRQRPEKSGVVSQGRKFDVWQDDKATPGMDFTADVPMTVPPGGVVYLKVTYLDRGYGRLKVSLDAGNGRQVPPDRFTNLYRTGTGAMLAACMRFRGLEPGGLRNIGVRIEPEGSKGAPLGIQSVLLHDKPFDDPKFGFVISDPWNGPYSGPTVKPACNATLKGKVMAGYQGWFRTPNDPEGRGWTHWGNMADGSFVVDMWPDVSQYPPSVLEKAGDVKLRSGRQAYLFSSAWPEVVDTHFRWMREHDIDGAFLQRFVSKRFHSVSGGPEWVLANVRAAANRQGRIWAVEYDVSGCPDKDLLNILKTDWKWLVQRFRLLDDPNYAREDGKPVVFIWGMPFPNRKISPETADQVVDFFKNDPVFGGNHVIGGIPSDWRKTADPWQQHIRKYDCVLTWMSHHHAEDLADFRKLGIEYYAHVKPGFSWANLKKLPSGDNSIAYTPRDGGRYYWKQLSRAAEAGADRLFVGMFDEYDEATAIMPMSDDHPPTPVRPGVNATFFPGSHAGETGEHMVLPAVALPLDSPPAKRVAADHFFARFGGGIVFPTSGDYKLSIEGAEGDDVELFLGGDSVLKVARLSGLATMKQPFKVKAGEMVPFRIEYRHRTGNGTLKLLWESSPVPRQAVPQHAFRRAWGRFINNEGYPADWWLQLTGKGRALIRGETSARPEFRE